MTELAATRPRLADLHRTAERVWLPQLAQSVATSAEEHAAAQRTARELIRASRGSEVDWVPALLQQFGLSSAEGLALLSLAEAYLRIPDTFTANLLVRDKLGRLPETPADDDAPLVVNAVNFGLALSQRLLADEGGQLRALLARAGLPLMRTATGVAVRRIAGHFVLGETIDAALARAADQSLLCSFDMLGEAARSAADAQRYLLAYDAAIAAVGRAAAGAEPAQRHGVSVKLSALHPRYETAQRSYCVPQLVERVETLALRAAQAGIGLTIDAEESERLELSLEVIAAVAALPSLRGWDGLGMAVQAYQKRALAVIDWADALAQSTGRRLGIRLVKGAYWDREIKQAQQQGVGDYPVYTRKAATDVSFLACARRLLRTPSLRPAFATHNALSIATLLGWIGTRRDVEFQRLHGMGEALYAQVRQQHGLPCRVYAPVGCNRDLLAYLVRRMLENGANSSFVHQLGDRSIPEQSLLIDPLQELRAANYAPHPSIPLPPELYPGRRNSLGLDLADRRTLDALAQEFARHWQHYPPRFVRDDDAASIAATVTAAWQARNAWADEPVEQRAALLERTADLLERDHTALMALLIREAGKTRADALGEVREAVDFCRYYAQQARQQLQEVALPGPTGELNRLQLAPRGVFACISPWNFPLSIFTGQVAAALVCGNTVVAKPAPQTPLIAHETLRRFREAGLPAHVLQLVIGGADAGAALVADARVAGVAFTGSTATARRIALQLLEDPQRPLVPLIAETGGINAMIVDSTALPEQVVDDVIASAFRSAGQRCSALRLLCLQAEISEPVLELLRGAMAELRVGDPADESTDVGPLIDAAARDRIIAWLAAHRDRVLYSVPLETGLTGCHVAPTLLQLDAPGDLQQEVFGPVLHVVRWQADELPALLDALNASGYGLTMGLHSRLQGTQQLVRERAHVGNLYVNRSMIGAVVGSQPFGGEGLSGTGPKAGGPHYLQRFCTERVMSVDTTSAGGNASLMNLRE